jgi:hypothetical protein
MSNKIKCVVEGGVITAAYDWDDEEWVPIDSYLMEESCKPEHIFEKLIGMNTGEMPTTIT